MLPYCDIDASKPTIICTGHFSAGWTVGPTIQPIIPHSPNQRVIPTLPTQSVIAGETRQGVVAGIAGQHVVLAVAGAVNVQVAREQEVFEIVAEGGGEGALNRVNAFVGKFGNG